MADPHPHSHNMAASAQVHGHDHAHGHAQGHGLGHTHGGHPHGPHSHHHHGETAGWRYGLAIALNLLACSVQFFMGLALQSSALLADAGHNAIDVLGLLLAGVAAWLMARKGGERRTYGYGKAGVLAALFSSLLLVFACGALVFDAVSRLIDPPAAPPAGGLVMAVAAGAVVINLLSGLLLMQGHPDDVNRKAAVLHMLADAAISVGVVAAGALIIWTGARWIDPVACLLIVAVIIWSSWRLLVQSLNLALDAVPAGIDVAAVRQWLRNQYGVEEVHDLHIWPISSTQTALTAHLIVPEGSGDRLIEMVGEGLQQHFGIAHSTIQIERKSCAQCEFEH